MAKVTVGDEAAADLDHIYDWGAEQFGVQVADAYLRKFDACFDLLRDYPFAGRTRHDLLPGLRSYTQDRHVIFYVVTEDLVTIARVLHAAQNVNLVEFD